MLIIVVTISIHAIEKPDVANAASGYLDSVVDARSVVGNIPQEGSLQLKGDLELAGKLQKFYTEREQNTDLRITQSTIDATSSTEDLAGDKTVCEQFDCVLGVSIGQKATPHIYNILNKSYNDIKAAYDPIKDELARKRPFVSSEVSQTCTPYEDEKNAKSGSFPSGHASTSYFFGLILREVAPEKEAEIQKRSIDFALSRAVCNVHWLSDIYAGFSVAESVFQAELKNADFSVALEEAKTEYQNVKDSNTATLKNFKTAYNKVVAYLGNSANPEDGLRAAQKVKDIMDDAGISKWNCAAEAQAYAGLDIESLIPVISHPTHKHHHTHQHLSKKRS
jgi:hypothetical protein